MDLTISPSKKYFGEAFSKHKQNSKCDFKWIIDFPLKTEHNIKQTH